MKHISLLAVLVAGVLASGLFAAERPGLLDLNGREVVVRVGTDPSQGRPFEKITVTIKGRTVEPKVDDANDSTIFKIYHQDQNDPVVKQALETRVYGWRHEDATEYYLPISSAELDNRVVMVRVYKEPNESPQIFDKYPIETDGRKVRLDFEGFDASAFVAIFGLDQKDKVLREVLGNAVFGWPYKKGLAFSLPKKPASQEQSDHCWTMADAIGNVMPYAAVEVYLIKGDRKLLIAEGTADAQGQLRTSFGLPDLRAFWYSGRKQARSQLRFVISHPQYGTAIVEPYPHVETDWLFVPLARPGSEADQRSIWGVVVDPNGHPVAGASVSAMGAIPTGAKWVGVVDSQRHYIVTDSLGRFRTYLPIAEDAQQIGILIPPKSEYYVKVESPAGLDLRPFKGRIPNGQATTIQLEHPGYFHTFVFEDQNGPITDPQVLESIEVRIIKPGQGNDIYLRYDNWKNGGKFPPGKYEASHYGYSFEHLTVTADSPEQLVFELSPPRTFYGRVLDGTTGGPLCGVEVRISREGPVGTDEDGRFNMTVSPQTTVHRIVLSKENYLTMYLPDDSAKLEDEGKYRLADVKMFPAAMVAVEPVATVKTFYGAALFRPQWFVVGENNPIWTKQLLAACSKHPADGIFRDFEVEANKASSFQVPAGVNLRIHLRVLGNIEWAPVTIAHNVILKQGEVYDAGRPVIGKPFKIAVEVLDSAGRPVEGVAVVVCGDHDPAVSSTGEEGLAFFDFVGYSRGEFIVQYKPGGDPNAPYMREAIPYEIAGPEDANSVFTLRVSDEMLYHLFK